MTALSAAPMRGLRVAAMAATLLAGCGIHPPQEGSRPRDLLAASYIDEFHKIDTAGKGIITFDQATAYYTAKFQQLDTARKGYLVAADIAPMLPLMGAATAEDLLSRLDNNVDGKVSLAEFLIIANWLFQKAHSRPDALTLDDVSAGAQGAPHKGGGDRQDKRRGQSGGSDMAPE